MRPSAGLAFTSNETRGRETSHFYIFKGIVTSTTDRIIDHKCAPHRVDHLI